MAVLGKYDEEEYEQLMLKVYLCLFLPLHVTLNEIEDLLDEKRKMRVVEYTVLTQIAAN